MGKLSDILRQGNGSGDIRELWSHPDAAAELAPLPAGLYDATIVKGELFTSKEKGTPGYRLEFVVSAGEFHNRRFWADCWLTPAALPQTKRDLGKLGVTDLAQLEQPLPAHFRCQVKLTLRKEDNGETYNRVRRFDVTGIEEIPRDPYAPDDEPTAGTATDTAADTPPDGSGDTSEGTGLDPIDKLSF